MNYMKQKTEIKYTHALLYCRVSSDRQKIEGGSLESQEYECGRYAENAGYTVEKVFKDDISGGGDFMNRPAMAELLKYMDDRPYKNYVVIFYDLKRFARDTEFHFKLKAALRIRQAKPECLNFVFGEEPEDEFVETVLAAQNQLERKQNRRQVIQKMRARIELGYWPFCPPPGLRNTTDEFGRKVLVSNYPLADIYKQAIEGYRDFEFNTLENVQNFILSKYQEHNINRPLSLNGVKRILSNILYAGYVEYEEWGVERRKGQHEGFINYETFLAVQDRLSGKAKPRLRKDYSVDFPVRGYALCNECHKPFTGAWFKGNGSEKKAYYYCKTIGCTNKYKMVLKRDLESNLNTVLKGIKPKDEVLNFCEAVLVDVWKERARKELVLKRSLDKSIRELENENSALSTRIAKTSAESLMAQYEDVIAKNLDKIKSLKEKVNKIKYTLTDFQTALSVVLDFVGHPIKQWETNDFKRKRLLLSTYFSQNLIWDPINGFQTVELPLILELCKLKNTSKNSLVEMVSNSWHDYYAQIIQQYQLLTKYKLI